MDRRKAERRERMHQGIITSDHESLDHGKAQLTISVTIGPSDVLCGRGTVPFSHVGNRRFRALVSAALPAFVKSENRYERSLLVHEIVNDVRQAGGRFLKKNNALMESWCELDDKQAKEKVGHAVRDALATFENRKKRKQRQPKKDAKTNELHPPEKCCLDQSPAKLSAPVMHRQTHLTASTAPAKYSVETASVSEFDEQQHLYPLNIPLPESSDVLARLELPWEPEVEIVQASLETYPDHSVTASSSSSSMRMPTFTAAALPGVVSFPENPESTESACIALFDIYRPGGNVEFLPASVPGAAPLRPEGNKANAQGQYVSGHSQLRMVPPSAPNIGGASDPHDHFLEAIDSLLGPLPPMSCCEDPIMQLHLQSDESCSTVTYSSNNNSNNNHGVGLAAGCDGDNNFMMPHEFNNDMPAIIVAACLELMQKEGGRK